MRDLVHSADPDVVETIKGTRQPFRQVIANNRAGGWRKLKPKG